MKRLIAYSITILVISAIFITCSEESEEIEYQLQVQPDSFLFTKKSNSGTLVISNGGSGELSWEISDKPDWLEASTSSGKVTIDNDLVILTANINQAIGQYPGTISITSNGGNKDIATSLDISVWNKVKDMPVPKMAHSSCVLDGKIYAIGGSSGNLSSTASKKLVVYDPLHDTWTTKTDMATGRFEPAIGYL